MNMQSKLNPANNSSSNQPTNLPSDEDQIEIDTSKVPLDPSHYHELRRVHGLPPLDQPDDVKPPENAPAMSRASSGARVSSMKQDEGLWTNGNGDFTAVITHTNIKMVCQALKANVIANGAFAITSEINPADFDLGLFENHCPKSFHLVLRDWIRTFGPNADFTNLERCEFYGAVYDHPEFEEYEGVFQTEKPKAIFSGSPPCSPQRSSTTP